MPCHHLAEKKCMVANLSNRNICNPIDILLTFTAVPSFIRCKVILFLADIFWFAHPEWLPKKHAIPRCIVSRIAVRRADRIVTHSVFSKQEIIRYLGVEEDKIEIAPHGIIDLCSR